MKFLSLLILALASTACAQTRTPQTVYVYVPVPQPVQKDTKYTAPGQAHVDYMHQRADTIRLLNNIQFSNSLKSKR